MKTKILGLLTLGLLAGQALAAPVLTISNVRDTPDAREYTIGWAFTLAQSVTITDLGYWDSGSDGLLSSHDVGVFSSAGSLLVSATVSSGTAGALDSGYRFTSIAPFVLAAGAYVIGGSNNGSFDPIVVDAVPSTIAGLTITNPSLFAFGSGLIFPDSVSSLDYYSPNFRITVPEPATLALLGLGLAGLGLSRRRRA